MWRALTSKGNPIANGGVGGDHVMWVTGDTGFDSQKSRRTGLSGLC